VIPKVDLKIETIEIPGPSRFMGWWCTCGQIHMGDLKYVKHCVRCGARWRRPDVLNRTDEPGTIT
jgi:hypothetical protein